MKYPLRIDRKSLYGFLLFLALVACTLSGTGNIPTSATVESLNLPPQWTATWTSGPTDTGEPILVQGGPPYLEKILTLDAGSESVVGIDYSRTAGLLVSISEDGTVRLWDTDDGKAVLQEETESRGWAGVVLDPEGSFFVLGLGDRIEIRNAETAEVVHTIRNDLTRGIRGMALFPEKKWLAATGAFSLQLFTNVTGDANAKPENGFSNTYFTDYTRPVFNADGTKIGFGGRYEGQDILSVEYLDEYMGKVTVNGGKGGNRFGQYGRVVDLKFADRDRLIVASQNTVAYYDDDDEEIIRTEIQNLAGISLNRTNDLLVSVTTGGRLILMHFPQLERVTEIQAHSGRINQLVFHNEREVFATAGEDGKIKIWRIIGD